MSQYLDLLLKQMNHCSVRKGQLVQVFIPSNQDWIFATRPYYDLKDYFVSGVSCSTLWMAPRISR